MDTGCILVPLACHTASLKTIGKPHKATLQTPLISPLTYTGHKMVQKPLSVLTASYLFLRKAPERPEDKAMLVIEQAREAKDVTLRATLLERAIGILEKVRNPRP